MSPNELSGDVMVLASPPPVDPDENSISTDIFQIVYEGRNPLRYVAIEIRYPPRTRTTAFAAK